MQMESQTELLVEQTRAFLMKGNKEILLKCEAPRKQSAPEYSPQ
jgi:hypothetical protein